MINKGVSQVVRLSKSLNISLADTNVINWQLTAFF